MSRDPRLDASCDLYAYDLCDGSETCTCMDEPEVSQELRASAKRAREIVRSPEICCCCKDPAARVTYHNYREQPFCWPCADAKCTHREMFYEPSKCTAGLDWHTGRNCSCRPLTGTPQANEQKETRVPHTGIDEGMAKLGIAWHVDKSKTFTTVILTGERYVGLGTAKRNPVDTYDRQTGFDIAMSRALHELADQVERGAHA